MTFYTVREKIKLFNMCLIMIKEKMEDSSFFIFTTKNIKLPFDIVTINKNQTNTSTVLSAAAENLIYRPWLYPEEPH